MFNLKETKKNKKGFTLVELMIVVVIMAILVAVAVPIYSAVTANSRKKTCYANQRMIVEQLNTMVMNAQDTAYNKNAVFTISTVSENDTLNASLSTTDTVYSEELITGLFNKMPFCPTEGNVITVTVTYRPGTDQGTPINPNLSISCSEHLS